MSGQWRESQLIVIFFKGMFYVSCSNIKIDIAPERQKESMTITSLPAVAYVSTACEDQTEVSRQAEAAV